MLRLRLLPAGCLGVLRQMLEYYAQPVSCVSDPDPRHRFPQTKYIRTGNVVVLNKTVVIGAITAVTAVEVTYGFVS